MAHDDPEQASVPDESDELFMLGDAEATMRIGAAEPDHEALGLHIANWWLKARRLRENMFGSALFADPAWDILLDLYTARARGERVQITSLSLAARVPHSTAIRWARIMTRHGLLVREKDPKDGRRVHVTLSEETWAMMKDYLERLSRDPATRAPPFLGAER